MAGLLGVVVLQSSSGYHLTPPVLTQLQSMSKNVDNSKSQVKTTEQKLSTVNGGLNQLIHHIDDDVNIYHQILPQLQSAEGSQGSGSGGN